MAGLFYLALAGWEVATERAFIMVSVMYLAVIFDRRAISLRGLALSAVLVLLVRPESLVEPGFQMSFAATLALVVVFANFPRDLMQRFPKWTHSGVSLVVSSIVAGAATAPFAAAHFNRIAEYGLLANLSTVPLMGVMVMPAGVLAAVLSVFGLENFALAIMAPPLEWTLFVAHWVENLPHPLRLVPSPPMVVLSLLTLGCLWAVLWKGRFVVKAFGILPVLGAFVIWTQVQRPQVLIDGSASLVGVLTPQGRSLSKPKGQGFAADSWLENDGDAASQIEAASRDGFLRGKKQTRFQFAGLGFAQLSGKGAEVMIDNACQDSDVVIVSIDVPSHEDCLILDLKTLEATGTLALYQKDTAIRVIATNQSQRPWNAKNHHFAPIVLPKGKDPMLANNNQGRISPP
jgi:competence protein ComEC